MHRNIKTGPVHSIDYAKAIINCLPPGRAIDLPRFNGATKGIEDYVEHAYSPNMRLIAAR